ncbi:SHOCT domain-containing protein [Flavilitoribacter nigricans]|nr:SHOCT domain-containing protein [Flavilitoribacter nigricans]
MAQFDIRELGGSGQWMKGGMTMVSDMFNANLKAKVEQLCNQLSLLIGSEELFIEEEDAENKTEYRIADNWWPTDLGIPATSGSQNNLRYAFFPGSSRLAVEDTGKTTVYDTLDHHISGVSQQQGNGHSLIFTSQHGRIDLEKLPVITKSSAKSTSGDKQVDKKVPKTKTPVKMKTEMLPDEDPRKVLKLLEQLSELHKNGVLTDEEFQDKKQELLSRI